MLRINIPLTTDEMRLLISNAERECRTPKDQARFILRTVLLGEHIPKNNTGVCEFPDPHASVMQTVN